MLQTGPADTLDFMLLGYGVILGVMVLYVLNLWYRFRNLKDDEAVLLEALDEENPPGSGPER